MYKSGEHIAISEIAQRYEVSHMPVREAFQCLKGEGLLELKQYKGARVLSVSIRDVGHIYDIRMMAEILILSGVIASDYGDEFLEKLSDINKKVDFSLPPDELNARYQEINNEFHYFMFTKCENRRAVDMYTFYSNLFRALKKKYPNTPEEISAAYAEHELIIEALRRRDAETLHRLVEQHATRAKHVLIGKMQADCDN